MNASELTLDIAVNLGRITRWAIERQEGRVRQFIHETDEFVAQLDRIDKKPQFTSTFKAFKKSFSELNSNIKMNDDWAEEVLTWANILTHRAKLA